MIKKDKLYKATKNPPVFESIKGILFFHGQPLTHEQKMRLKAEALTLKVGILFEYLTSKVADEMQREIIENHTEATPNGKDERTLDYYRAILADRRILIQEVENLASYEPSKPKKIDTPNGVMQ